MNYAIKDIETERDIEKLTETETENAREAEIEREREQEKVIDSMKEKKNRTEDEKDNFQ